MKGRIYTKSQLTILIIIGILIFSMILFLSYLLLFKTEKRLVRQSIESKQLNLGITSIKEFVNKCIEDTASKALELIGKQGGYIYKSETGFITDPNEMGADYIDYLGNKVSYGMKRPNSDVANLYFWRPPRYPWDKFPYTDNTYTTLELNKGYYGQNVLPDLLGSNHSILSQIEHYINNNLKFCLNFDYFENYRITYTNLTTSAIIGDNSLIINARIPIDISKITGEETTKMEKFSVPIKVRLKLIYNLAKTIVEGESNSLSFDSSKVIFDVMEISLVRNVFEKDYILSINDVKSNIYGKHFTFQSGIQNRYPMLHYIVEQNLPTLVLGDKITFDTASSLKIIRGGQIIFNQEVPYTAYDPDGDILSYSYNPELPYIIGPQDIPPFNNKFLLTIKVNDGLLEDYQDITFQTS